MLDRRDPPDGQGATIDGTEDTPSASAAGGPALPVRVNPAALPSGPVPFGNEEEPADPLVGSVLAERYEILSRVSRGGMGVVYKARHISLGTLFAIKLIIGRASELSQQKFLREAQLASKVQHPNTVYIADFGLLPEGHPYLAMEYVDGPTLGQALGHGRFEPQRACEIALQLARGIQPIHDKGIVHRDLKPENIFLLKQEDGKDFVKIGDFGIAKDTATLGPGDLADASAAPLEPDTSLTEGAAAVYEPTLAGPVSQPSGTGQGSQSHHRITGTAAAGTPSYMAPEQVRGLPPDPRSDQYALGCILYKMLTGSAPFSARTGAEIMQLHISAKVVPPEQRAPGLKLSPTLNALLLRCLAKDPQQRFGSVRELGEAIEFEVDLLRLARGERVMVPASRAARLRASGYLVPLGRWRVPLWSVASLLALLVVGVVYLGYRRFRLASDSQSLRPGELLALRRRAVEVLGDYLKAAPREQRQLSLTALGRCSDVRIYPQLLPLLGDVEPDIRALAAEDLGRLGERQALAPLRALLVSTQPVNVQVAAAHALALLGDERGDKFLHESLASRDEETRLRAAFQLCDKAPEAQTLLRSILARGLAPSDIALNILTCLTHGGDGEARKQLLSQMSSAAGLEGQLTAAARLYRSGEPRGRELLFEHANKPGPQQLVAARLLAGPTERGLGALFRQVVESKQAEPAARLLAVEGLGDSGQATDARLLGPWLEPSSDAALRIAAAGAILMLAQNDPGILSEQGLSWARSALGDQSWQIRGAAVAALGELETEEATNLLAQALQDQQLVVRQVAARALGRRSERSALLALRTALRDREGSVRAESLRSLTRVGGKLQQRGEASAVREIVGWLQEYLAQASELERVITRGALLKLGETGQRSSLLAALDSSSPDTRRLVAEQLERDSEALPRLLKDDHFAVRFAAAQRLASFDDKRAVPVLREALVTAGSDGLVAYGLLGRLGEKVAPPSMSGATPQQRSELVDAVSGLPRDLALPLLRSASHDSDAETRRHVVTSSGALLEKQPNDEALLAVVRGLLADEDAGVRAHAALVLAGAQRAAEAAGLPMAAADSKEAADAATPSPGPAAGSPPVENSPGSSSGLLIKSSRPVQFQIDHRPWQLTPVERLELAVGSHVVSTLAGPRTVVIKAGQTTTLELAESQTEELARQGLLAYDDKDLRKSQKLLEKAKTLCGKARKQAAGCAPLMLQVATRLGQIYQSQQRPAEAMTEYQRVLQLSSLVKGGGGERKSEAQSAIAELSQQLGQLIIPKTAGGRCQEVSVWMPPGTHIVELAGKSATVSVRAKETVKVGSCP